MLPTLSSGDLTLRPWLLADAPDLQREVQDPETVRWMAIDLPYTLQDAEGFIAGTSAAWEDRSAAHFVISAPDGRFLGYLGVLSVENHMRVVELGYWVARSARGRGVATAAVGLVIDWIRTEVVPDRIELGMLVGNAASRAVAEKSGFVLEGVKPGRIDPAGNPRDEWIFVFSPQP